MVHGLLRVFPENGDPILLQYVSSIFSVKESEEVAAEILRVRNER